MGVAFQWRYAWVNIVVCMKETPDTTVEKRFTAEMRLDRGVTAVINPFDEYTIEEGLRQQEKHGGEVVVLCMGPASASESIRRALAMGADRAVHVSDPALGGSDAIGTARVLAAALKKIGYDLVLFGSAAADAYGGVVPAAVAELLGAPLLSFAVLHLGRRRELRLRDRARGVCRRRAPSAWRHVDDDAASHRGRLLRGRAASGGQSGRRQRKQQREPEHSHRARIV